MTSSHLIEYAPVAQEHVNPRVIATWDGRDAAWRPSPGAGARAGQTHGDPFVDRERDQFGSVSSTVATVPPAA
ncbi:MAG: hypothetical protein L0H84_20420, partial [Pseudonocardia sp.]|nr:hypothetical protein [Pseudonocardia sp.]